jgi:4-hydroxybenzoate polyprenyltransferase
MKQYLRGWLDLLRISNAPTCLSNVLVGWVIGGGKADLIPLAVVCGMVIAIYLAGMILNDVFDVEWDRRHRPDRPIAAGLISRGMACSVAIIMLIAATGAGAWLGPATFTATLLLVGLVIAYDIVHRIAVAAIITMSACRAMVYLVAAVAAGQAVPEPLLIGAMLAIALWIAGLTLLARREAVGQALHWPVILFPTAVVIALLLIPMMNVSLTVLVGVLLLLQFLWIVANLLRPGSVVPAVLASIAGISLLDALLLGMLDAPIMSMVAVCCFGVVTIVHRPLPGT